MVITKQLTDTASASTASDIQLGSCVTEIGMGAFSGYTNITDVEFPESLTTIGVGAFSGSSITSVEFPSGVTTIGASAFTDALNLSKIVVNSTTPPILGNRAFDGSKCGIEVPMESYSSYTQSWSRYRNRIIYDGIDYLLKFENETNTSIMTCAKDNTISSDDVRDLYIDDIKSTTIGSCARNIEYIAFSGMSIGNVTFEEGVTNISSKAFLNINPNQYKTSIILPQSLQTVGTSGFGQSYGSFDLEITAYGNNGLSLTKGNFVGTNNGKIRLNLYNMTINNSAFSNGAHITSLKLYGYSNVNGQAFYDNHYLNDVYIGSGVRIIGDDAFKGCWNLSELTFENGILEIGIRAFRNCSGLTSVVLPDSLIILGDEAFIGCKSLRNASLSSGLTVINEGTFSESGIYNIVIPNTITNISDNAFKDCQSLSAITLSSGMTTINKSTFEGCNSLTNIRIPNTITSIGNNAFNNCSSLTEVILGNNVSTIGNNSFRRNYQYSTDSVTPLTVYMNDNLTSVGDYAFYCGNYGISYINKLSSNLSDIGERAFGKCKFTNFVLPSTLRTIGDMAFYSCSGLTTVTISSGITSIGSGAFYMSDVKNAIFENGVTEIKGMFNTCRSLSSVTIPNSVTSIGSQAFSNCTSLTNITIPNSVTSIGGIAFQGCNKLKTVVFNSTNPPILGNGVFNNTPISNGTGFIYVPCESVEDYKSASGWSAYTDSILGLDPCVFEGKIRAKDINNNVIILESCSSSSIRSSEYKDNTSIAYVEIGECVTSIGFSAFENCSSLISINIPNSITIINSYTFADCTNLPSINLPNSLITIGDNAFYRCSSLSSVTIPNSVTSIGGYAFGNCGSMSSCTIGSGVTDISYQAFSNCTSLTNITIPNSVTSIGVYAFSNCSSLITASLSNSITSIAGAMFKDCIRLLNINIPNGVTSIGGSAFQGCYSLTSIIIPSGITSIGSNAFNSCRSLSSIIVNSTTPPTIGSNVFDDTNNCPIYVPSQSVETYKEAVTEGWSNYASRIQAIPNS